MALTQISTNGITDATIATADIAADAVTGAKIADDAVDTEHLAADIDIVTTGGIDINSDTSRVKIGAGDDLQLYHDGSNSYILNGGGDLRIWAKTNEYAISCIPDGAVNLFHDNTKKLETTSAGVTIYPGLKVDSGDIETYISYSNGNSTGIMGTESDHSLEIRTNNTERMRITSGGFVGIGETSPETILNVKGTDTAYSGDVAVGAIIQAEDTSSRKIQLVAPGAVGEAGVGTPTSHHLTLFTANTERVRIDTSGSLRVGNTTQAQYTAADDLIVGSGSGDRGLTIYSGSSDAGVIAFSDGTADTAYRSGQIIYSHSADSMIFRTNGNYTRLTIDSTGIVDVTGKLRVDISTTGGAGAGTAEGIFLRNTNETDNNAVSIFGGADDYGAAASAINFINVDHSANAGNISFDTRTTGNAYAQRLLIGTDKVMFSVDAKVDSDNARDLGTAATRWKDLYLAGDVHVASGKGIDFSATADGNATDTSELLDDYEEGTWTPVASRSTGGAISGSYGSQQGKYIKVGNLVTVEYYVQISSVSSQGSGLLMIDGLPYSPTSAYQNSGAVFFNNCVDNDYVRAMTAHSDFGGCIYYVTDQKGDSLLSADWEGGYIGGTLTYTTGL